MATSDSTVARRTAKRSRRPLDIDAKVAVMQGMTVGQLGERYAELYGEPTRSRHKMHLIRKIAWRMQALAEGDLSERARRRAEELANDADITIPVYNFTETHYLSTASVTPAYKATLFGLTGKVNQATFKGFAAGEVLFLGASGSVRGYEDWEITFRFAASPNVTGLTIGDILNIDKPGWAYLWIRYADAEDQKVLVKQPIAAYVEQVYESGDFSGLGIGV